VLELVARGDGTNFHVDPDDDGDAVLASLAPSLVPSHELL
jgi:hypothetical protein